MKIHTFETYMILYLISFLIRSVFSSILKTFYWKPSSWILIFQNQSFQQNSVNEMTFNFFKFYSSLDYFTETATGANRIIRHQLSEKCSNYARNCSGKEFFFNICSNQFVCLQIYYFICKFLTSVTSFEEKNETAKIVKKTGNIFANF